MLSSERVSLASRRFSRGRNRDVNVWGVRTVHWLQHTRIHLPYIPTWITKLSAACLSNSRSQFVERQSVHLCSSVSRSCGRKVANLKLRAASTVSFSHLDKQPFKSSRKTSSRRISSLPSLPSSYLSSGEFYSFPECVTARRLPSSWGKALAAVP